MKFDFLFVICYQNDLKKVFSVFIFLQTATKRFLKTGCYGGFRARY
ncbi:hypothetical protein HPHPH42_0943 [Helicobacter pylori Hp H-42]|uniref:Uncharacterized protein n=1 Tax=Helicobacter pylori Hp H-42 TaxID=992047 RepID=A0AB33XHE7_HELPX|nr:hypothetical protein HPHPH42_0943 [Helicobacter pylori Hp H-42]